MQDVRTHDSFYLGENYKSEPKEYFKLIGNVIESAFDFSDGSGRLIDVGCETGSFLWYMRERFPGLELHGIDVMQELLDQVNKPVDRGIIAHKADISNRDTIPKDSYDIVTLMGVLGIFDDYKIVIDNCMSMVKDGGFFCLFGAFNPEPYDVLMRCRLSDSSGPWEKGWNIFAIDSIAGFCAEKGWRIEQYPFEMPFDIPRHQDDPLRSWTMQCDGKRIVVNGLQLIHHFVLFLIRK